ncbi:MAG: alpha/beta fold hydrolase, partial [Planctomycetota bacterium]|nr:alpha/beta fold hydrolase [Planctomycetota bacterium]
RLDAFAARSAAIFAWDPPGHGEARGTCFLGAREPDMIRALAEHARTAYPKAGSIILYGWSLGAGASIAAASDNAHPSIGGVIAEAPYRVPWTPARNVMRLAGFPHRLNLPIAMALLGMRLGVGPRWRSFDRAQHAQRLTPLLLVIHGILDEVCPIWDSDYIAESAPNGHLCVVAEAGHNDLWTEPEFAAACIAAIDHFLDRVSAEPLVKGNPVAPTGSPHH